MSTTMAAVHETMSTFGRYMMTVDMFPVFFFAHLSIGSIVVRDDSKHLGPKFRQKHPFVSWLCTLMTGLSGVFVANFLFGDPLLDILKENFLIGYLTVIWYLMNYSPFDVVYNVAKHPVFFFPASILQECLRLRFLYLGVQTAAKVYPNAPLIILVGGIIKGNGYGFLKIIERLLRGHWNPQTNEFLDITYFAKSGAIASLLLVLHHYKVLIVQIEFLYLALCAAFIFGRLVLMIGKVSDPLAPLLSPFSKILFGSWEDELSGKSDVGMSRDKVQEDMNNNSEGNQNGSNKKKRNKKRD